MTVAVMDSAAFAALQRARATELQRTYGGIVSTPRNALEERLARGDVALRDSLLDEWSSERDPDRRLAIAGMLRWPAAGVRVDSLLRQHALAIGDTGTAYSITVSIARSRTRLLYPDEAQLLVAMEAWISSCAERRAAGDPLRRVGDLSPPARNSR